MAEAFRTYCKNCPSSCGMAIEVEDGRITSARGDRDHPITEGYFCVKGQMAADLANGDEPRLRECMVRSGDGHVPIPANKAMDEIAEKLRSIIAEHGPNAVALYWGTGAYGPTFGIPAAKSFMASIGSPLLFSTMTIDQSAHWVTDMRFGVFSTGKPHMEQVEAVMMWGNNPLVSHVTRPWNGITNSRIGVNMKQARNDGTRFIVVDPRRTETAKISTHHLQIVPGEDPALAAGIIRIILDRKWGNQDFIKRYACHVEELREAVDPFTPEAVAARTGISVEQILEAAEIMGTARKAVTGAGTGVSMSGVGNLGYHLIYVLNAICGGYVLPGETMLNPGIFFRAGREARVIRPSRSWEAEPHLAATGYGRIFDEFPTSQLPREILDPGKNRIRALIVQGANPMMAFGDPDQTRAALEALDLLVMIDPRMHESAEMADYVIPPPLQFEIPDISISRDRLFHKPFVQYSAPPLARPPGTIPEWAFFNGLAQRLGHRITVKLGLFGRGFHDVPGGLELDPDEDWAGERMLGWACDQAGVSLEELKRHPGGMEYDCEPFEVQEAEDDGLRLDLCPPDVAQELADYAVRRPNTGFTLISRRIMETMNSMFRFGGATQKRYPTNWLYIHPADLADCKIADGEPVKVTSQFGSIIGRAKSDKTMRPGVVSMTHCWGALNIEDEAGIDPNLGGHTSRLVSMKDELQSYDAMPQQSAIPVEIQRLVA